MNTLRREKDFCDVVDIDPYGTAIPFLEGSISSVKNNGLLCVTFTDMAVLCARKPHVCFYKMGSAPLGKAYCHEMALRMVLYTINTMANKHGKMVEPLLSLTVDFYIRLFIRVKVSLSSCHTSISKYSNVYQCTFCESFWLQRLGFHQTEKIGINEKRVKKFGSKKLKGKPATEEESKDEVVEEVKTEQPLREKIVNAKVEVPSNCKTCGRDLMLGGPIWNDKIHSI